jgi:hypothetical protein
MIAALSGIAMGTIIVFNVSVNDDKYFGVQSPFSFAHSVELKVYTRTPANKDISFFLVARSLGNNLACHNTISAFYHDGVSNFSNVATEIKTNGCQQSYIFPKQFPANYFEPVLDSNGAPTGWFCSMEIQT